MIPNFEVETILLTDRQAVDFYLFITTCTQY